jgi:hypothetical protein
MIHHFPPFSLLNILPEKDVTNKKSVKQHFKKQAKDLKIHFQRPVFNSKPLIEVIICNYALFPDKPWD